jgi:hypothetical protein
MNSMLYTFVLIASVLVILLGLFALIMALIRFGKQKGSSDPQAQKSATKRLISGILSAIFLCIVGVGLLLVVLYYILK